MIRTYHRARIRAAVIGAALIAAAAAFAPVAAATTTADTGEVYVIHGLPGVTADVLIDGESVQSGVAAKTIVGPFDLAAGDHTVTLQPTAGMADELSAMVTVEAGTSLDVVAHKGADPTAPPVITVYTNNMDPVAADKGRLVVAHTAAVPPADIRVNGQVEFSNVANGEVLWILVPAGTYSVDIVPTGTAGPAVFGPVDLTIAGGQLTRVFALGSVEEATMDVVVQTMPLPIEGSDTPSMVETGSGGQAAAFDELSAGTISPAVPLGVAALLVVAGLGLVRRRHAGGSVS